MNQFFKQTLLVLGCLISFWANAQQNLNMVSPITISIPSNLPANTADWAINAPPIMITAKTANPTAVDGVQSWLLVTIKKGGTKVCGSYTPQTVPLADFNAQVKTWIGASVVSLLGNPCTLTPGEYEFCVQFFAKDKRTLFGESCRPFTIKESKAQTYSPPTNISPINEKSFTEKELAAPVTFRWTPLIPRPKDPIIYRLRVWQVAEGQTGIQAMKTSTALVEKDIENITQANERIVFPKSCKGCTYIWRVEGLSKNAEQGGEKSLGVSEPSGFKIIANPVPPAAAAASCNLSISSFSASGSVGSCGAVPGGASGTVTGAVLPLTITTTTPGVFISVQGNNFFIPPINGAIVPAYVPVTVTDNVGCSTTTTIEVAAKFDPVRFILNASHVDAACATVNNGSITANFTRIGVGGGSTPVPNPQSYTVTGYGSTVFGPVIKPIGTTLTGLASGTYVVTGSGSSCWDLNGQSMPQTIGVASATCPCTLSITNQNPNYGTIGDFCGKAAGGGYGIINGSATSTYTITSGNATLVNNPMRGIYVPAPSIAQNPNYNITYVPVSIIDNTGCAATATLTVYPEFPGIRHNINATHQNVTCTGLNNGSINATLTTTGVPGGNMFNPSQAYPQTYTVTGTGGTVFGPVTKNFGTSVTGLAAGSYIVTGQSSLSNCWFGGNNTYNVTITASTCPCNISIIPNSINCTMPGGGPLCYSAMAISGSGTINGGSPPYTTLDPNVIITGNTFRVAPPLNAGPLVITNHYITIKDFFGCFASAQVQSCSGKQQTNFTLIFTKQDASCNNTNDGSITPNFTRNNNSLAPLGDPQTYKIMSTGNPIISSITRNFGTTVNSLAPGTYILQGETPSCWSNNSSLIFTIGNLSLPSCQTLPIVLTSNNINPTDCITKNGSVGVIATGGNGVYTYNWNTTPIQTGHTAINLAPGNYTVTVTSGNVSKTATYTVPQTSCPPLVLNTTILNPATCTSSNGIASVTATGGNGTYTYSWSSMLPTPPIPLPIPTTATVANLKTGNYNVTVTSGSSSQTAQIYVPNNIVPLNVGIIPFSLMINKKRLRVYVNGIIATPTLYSFTWNNGMTSNQIIVNKSTPPRTYSVLVTKRNTGCTGTATFNY